jgi:hypothetical protein
VLRGTNDVAVPFAEIETDTSGITHYLDGVRTLKEAASLARLDDFEAAKIACALLFLGAVERVPVVDLGEVAAAAQGAPPPTHPVAEDPPFMIAPSEPEPVIGMESSTAHDDQPISLATAEPPVMLMEPEPAIFMEPEPPPEPVRFEAPPIVPPPPPAPAAQPPARRAYDVAPASPPRPVPAPEPEPVRAAPPAASRPSQEDLAALDQILNSGSDGPPVLDKSVAAAASRPTPRPGGGKTSGPARTARRGGASRAPLLVGVGAALALAGAAAWFFVLRPRGEAAEVTVDNAAPVATSPAASAAPPAVVPATPVPPPAPPDARALLQAGSYPEAAQLFAEDLKAAGRGAATVQLLIACSAETVQKAVDNVGAMELVIVPHRFDNRDCYRMCWGVYPTSQAATTAASRLPPYFQQPGVRPRVMRAAEIVP